jgi:arylformamidase
MQVEEMAAHGWSVAILGYSLAPEAALTEFAQEISLSLGLARRKRRFNSALRDRWSCPDGPPGAILPHSRLIPLRSHRSWPYPASMILRRFGYLIEHRIKNDGSRDYRTFAAAPSNRSKASRHCLRFGGIAGTLMWDSKRFRDARSAAGGPGELIAVDGADHFTILEELRRPDGKLVRHARALVEKAY